MISKIIIKICQYLYITAKDEFEAEKWLSLGSAISDNGLKILWRSVK